MLRDLHQGGYCIYDFFEEVDQEITRTLFERPSLTADQKEKIIEVLRIPVGGFSSEEELEGFYHRFGPEGVLQNYLPRWKQRIFEGLDQHSIYSFDLARHTAMVVERVQESSIFKSLTERDQELLLLAALYYNIGKKSNIIDDDYEGKSLVELDLLAQSWAFNGPLHRKLVNILRTSEKINYFCNKPNPEFLLNFDLPYELAFVAQQNEVYQMACVLLESDSFAVAGSSDWWTTNRKDIMKKIDQRIKPLLEELESKWFPLVNGADYLNQLPKRYFQEFNPEDGRPAVEMIVIPTSRLPDMFEHGVKKISDFVMKMDLLSLMDFDTLCASYGPDRRFKEESMDSRLLVTGEVVVASPLDLGSSREDGWRYAFDKLGSPKAQVKKKVAEQAQQLVQKFLPGVSYSDFLTAARTWIETYDIISDRGELVTDAQKELPSWLDSNEKQVAFRATLSLVEKLIREYPDKELDEKARNYFGLNELWDKCYRQFAHTFGSLVARSSIDELDESYLNTAAPQVFEAKRALKPDEKKSNPNNEILLNRLKVVGVVASNPPKQKDVQMARKLDVPLVVISS